MFTCITVAPDTAFHVENIEVPFQTLVAPYYQRIYLAPTRINISPCE